MNAPADGETKRRHTAQSRAVWLTLLYAVGTILRIALAFTQSANPVIMADESLYFNIARSLATSGEAALRGQPVGYGYMLYPLILSPLMALPQSVDMHRAIQVLNALIMNLAIFPAAALARRVARNNAAIWATAAATLLLPDMVIAQFAMAECVGYTLITTCVYFAYRLFRGERLPVTAVLAGICCALACWLKPGYVALGISTATSLFLQAARHKDKRTLAAFGSFAASMAMACLILFTISQHLYPGEAESVYQNLEDARQQGGVLRTINGMTLYSLFFPAGCLLLPIAIPAAHWRRLRVHDRYLLLSLITSSTIIIIGTVFSVYLDEYIGDPFVSRIHLRYVAALYPPFLSLCLSPELDGRKLNGALAATLALFAAGLIVIGTGSIAGGKAHPVDALTLSILKSNATFTDVGKLITIVLLAACALAGYSLHTAGWNRRAKSLFAASLMLWWGACNAAGYAQSHHNMDPLWKADAIETAAFLQEKTVLFAAKDNAFFWNPATALDIQTRKPLPTVELGDLFAHTLPDGIYQPFTPKQYWHESPERLTPQPDWLVIDAGTLNTILPAASVLEKTVYSTNGKYALLPIANDTPWIHSGLCGLNEGWTTLDSALYIFDAALCNKEYINVSLHVRADTAGSAITLASGKFAQSFELGTDDEWIQADIPVEAQGEPMRVSLTASGNAYIYVYAVK